MKCLKESEVSGWLLEQGLPGDPYRGDTAPDHYLQFSVPTRYLALEAFVRQFYSRIIPETESLIHFTDWGLYQESQMMAVAGIRTGAGECRTLREAPGHVVATGEVAAGVALFSLAAAFAWSCYLYVPSERTILYNWEGELFDFWTDGGSRLQEMRLLLKEFDLEEIMDG
jgi:hypothetical protein